MKDFVTTYYSLDFHDFENAILTISEMLEDNHVYKDINEVFLSKTGLDIPHVILYLASQLNFDD